MFTTEKAIVKRIQTQEEVAELERLLRTSKRSRPLAIMAFACEPAHAPVPPAAYCEEHAFDVAYISDCTLVGSLSGRLGRRHALGMGEARVFPSFGSIVDEDFESWKSYWREDEPGKFAEFLNQAARCMKNKDRLHAEQGERAAAERKPGAVAGAEQAAPLAFAPAEARAITTEAEVRALLDLIHDDARERPLLVVSQKFDGSPTILDLEQLASDLEGFAHVAVLTEPMLAWAFNANTHLPVYNGAARLYPAEARAMSGEAALRYLYRAPSEHESKRTHRRIVADAIGCAASSYCGSGAEADEVRGEVVVGGLFPNAARAVCLDPKCIITSSEVASAFGLDDLPVERVFKKGMVLRGAIDAKTRLLHGYTEGVLATPEEALAGYRSGSTVLVRVTSVEESGCEVELFPGVRAHIDAKDALDEKTSLVTVLVAGMVVSALVVERGEDGQPWLLSIREAGEELLPAPSLMHGGPSWLDPEDMGRVEHMEDTLGRVYGEEAALAAIDVPVPQDAGPYATVAIRGLFAQAHLSESENTRLRKELRQMQDRLDRERSERLERNRSTKGCRRYRMPREIKFADADEKWGFQEMDMDHSIQKEWYRQTDPSERDELCLPGDWAYGENFFATLADTDVELAKVLRCMVNVLLDRNIDKREAHPLRVNACGGSPARALPDGSLVWRCYIEQRTPQAARLHFSRSSDGTVTFHSVRKHDDMRV